MIFKNMHYFYNFEASSYKKMVIIFLLITEFKLMNVISFLRKVMLQNFI